MAGRDIAASFTAIACSCMLLCVFAFIFQGGEFDGKDIPSIE